MMRKDISQPKCRAMTGMVKGANKAPNCAPALKRLVAKALSFLGKYSAVTLMAQGKLPDSPTARIERAERKSQILTVEMLQMTVPVFSAVFKIWRASSKVKVQLPVEMPAVAIPQKVCKQAPTDQIPIAHRYPFFVPI